jgi:carboxyvinyl-carboxyphosphonate phosphorylmutase
MDWTARRERLRAIIGEDRCVFPASVFDGISARLAEEIGFEAVMLAGSVASFTVLAAPDNSLMTLTEFAGLAYRINRAAKLPLLVDADHGFGNALNVKRTVEELESAGISALTIEDTRLPGPFGATALELIPIAEGVGKMRAALAGRQDPRLVIVGRTALGITGLDDTIQRLKAYEAAGVDMLFIGGFKSTDQLDAIAGAVRLPLFLGGVPETWEADYLKARNVRITLRGHDVFWASVGGVFKALTALRQGVKPSKLENIAPPELRRKLLRESDYESWEESFLR